MPVLTTTVAFDMHALPPIYLPVDDASATRVLDSHLDDYVYDQTYQTGWTIYNGSFTYDANDNIFGTVTSVGIYSGSFRALSSGGFSLNGTLQQSLTGLTKDASVVAGFFASENVNGLIAYLLDGADKLTGSAFGDVLDGFAGADELIGGAGSGQLFGGDGNDILLGGLSTAVADTELDKLYGGNNDDLLRQLGGIIAGEVFDGGSGTDTIELLPSLTPSSGAFGPQTLHDFTGATLTSIEKLDIKSAAGTQSWVSLNFSQVGGGLSGTATIVGGAGRDVVALLAGSAGTYTIPTFARTNWTTPVTLDDAYDAVLLQATGAGDYTLKASQGHAGVEILTGAGGNDTFYGSAGIEQIDGGAGNDTIFGSAGNDRMAGGDGRDTFDYSAGFAGFAAGTVIRINGGDHPDGASVAFPLAADTLVLQGKANDFTFSLNGTITTIANALSGVTYQLTNVEKVDFTAGVSNVVTLQNRLLEQADLAISAYPPAVTGGGWHRLSAIELGLLPQSPEGSPITYTMVDGRYDAIWAGIASPAHAGATVSIGVVNGVRTLTIAFAGTDETADFADYFDFSTQHYAKFAPLIAAIDEFIKDAANDIQKVFVSGHSLGAGMVQEFMSTHSGAMYQAVTIGSPGGDNAVHNLTDTRIVNFIHTDDLVPKLGDASSLGPLIGAAGLAIAAAWPFAGLGALVLGNLSPKAKDGIQILIDSSADSSVGLVEHSATLYRSSIDQ